jgi:delta8-fatty-acid desaturase
MIAQGDIVVIFEGQVLKLNGWIEKHPGGKLPLLQMVGVDASSEIAA